MENVTDLLVRYSDGDKGALEAILPVVYLELRRLAQSYMRKENSAHTLQATSLVHEAYFRLINQKSVQWKNRSHFFGIAAQVMRRILVDHARSKLADKRGGDATKLNFDEAFHWTPQDDRSEEILLVDSLLERLQAMDERQAKIVEMRFFSGLSVEETAEALEISPATVKREWSVAKAWLYRELSRNDEQTNA